MSERNESERWDENPTEVASPHVLVSSRLFDTTHSARKKLVNEVMDKLGLSQFDADTLVNSAADIKQLRNAIAQPQVRYVSQHTFRYIEMDVVTWRILPSPENVRFEDRRLGQSEPYRFGALGNSQAVLTMHVDSLAELLDDLVQFSLEIYRDSPHTKTIATRGIETGGVLALSRITADDSAQEFGILESTDGFSRTVGAHAGLGLKPRDILERLNSSENELKFRKELISLRDKDLKGNRISDDDRRRLRCSVMPRAQVIIGYEYRPDSEEDIAPSFDEARRDLVGHIHMAPALAFSLAASSAAKARAIRAILARENQLPIVEGLTEKDVENCLAGEISAWSKAGYELDQLAPLFLSAYKPNLNSRNGRLIKKAVTALTGQTPTQSELTDIAVDVAVRPALQSRGLSKVEFSQSINAVRSILAKTWDSSVFTNIRPSQRSLEELKKESLLELSSEVSSGGKISSTDARSELAAIASYAMSALTSVPLLERAPGRRNLGNNDEPNKVISELLKSEVGILQLSHIIDSLRKGKSPRLIDEKNPLEKPGAESDKVTAKLIKSIYDKKSFDETAEVALGPKESIVKYVAELNQSIWRLEECVELISELADDSGIVIVDSDGLPLQSELDKLRAVQESMTVWNAQANKLAKERRKNANVNQTDLD